MLNSFFGLLQPFSNEPPLLSYSLENKGYMHFTGNEDNTVPVFRLVEVDVCRQPNQWGFLWQEGVGLLKGRFVRCCYLGTLFSCQSRQSNNVISLFSALFFSSLLRSKYPSGKQQYMSPPEDAQFIFCVCHYGGFGLRGLAADKGNTFFFRNNMTLKESIRSRWRGQGICQVLSLQDNTA